ncbi:hypothetical protein [Kitasatospora sp. NPDC093806]|uniref:bpX5 domain-containing protein n=1 Tax=Kitasatospora sp. NPDC093806 TaxID=3155075 RepID=UPI003445808F
MTSVPLPVAPPATGSSLTGVPVARSDGAPPAGVPAVPLRWERREPPLTPAAVLAVGDAVPALAAATRERLADGARLGVLADDDVLLVLGAETDLPWSDGARYLGRDGELLVPTTARPLPAAPLWRAALGAAPGELCVLTPDHALVAPVPAPATDPEALTPYTRRAER